MKKQTALLLSTLVLMSALSVQSANAFSLKFLHKKHKPAVVAPVKKEVATKPACPCAKPAAKAPVKPACPCTKPAAKAPVKK